MVQGETTTATTIRPGKEVMSTMARKGNRIDPRRRGLERRTSVMIDLFVLLCWSALGNSFLVSAQSAGWPASTVESVPVPEPTKPAPTLPTGGSTLVYIKNEVEWELGKCEGDCDRDRDCQGDLECFRPEDDDLPFVWGCHGEPREKRNYCIDPKDIPPTYAPTRKPTPRPTPRPTRSPTRRPTENPTFYPTLNPTFYPTFNPTPFPTTAQPSPFPSVSPSVAPSASPTSSPSASPSSMPSIPDKIWVPFSPYVVELTFPKQRERKLHHHNPTTSSILHKEIDLEALGDIVTDLLSSELPFINRYFWEVMVEIDFKEEVMSLEENKIVLTYEFSGDVAFVDTPHTILATKEELRSATARAMNSNLLLSTLHESEDPVLSSVQSLAVSWAGGEPLAKSQKVGIFLLVLVLIVCVIGAAFLYRSRLRKVNAAFKNPVNRSRINAVRSRVNGAFTDRVDLNAVRSRMDAVNVNAFTNPVDAVRSRIALRQMRSELVSVASEAPFSTAQSTAKDEAVVSNMRSPMNLMAMKSKEAWRRVTKGILSSPSGTLNNDSPDPSAGEQESELESSSELEASLPVDNEGSSICGMSTSDWSVAHVGMTPNRQESSLLDTCKLPPSSSMKDGCAGESSIGDNLSVLGELRLGSVLGEGADDRDCEIGKADEAPGDLKNFSKTWKESKAEPSLEDQALGVSLADTAVVMKNMVGYLPSGLANSNFRTPTTDYVQSQDSADIGMVEVDDQATISVISQCTGMQHLNDCALEQGDASTCQDNTEPLPSDTKTSGLPVDCQAAIGEIARCTGTPPQDLNECASVKDASKNLDENQKSSDAADVAEKIMCQDTAEANQAQPSTAKTSGLHETPNPPQDADDETLFTSITKLEDAGMVQRDYYVPPGNLGVAIDSTAKGIVVHAVKPASPLEGIIFPGDRIIAVDDEDTKRLSASVVTNMIASKKDTQRKLTVLSVVTGVELPPHILSGE